MCGNNAFSPPAEHHERHYISDGNVVLSAVSQDKTRTVVFRVHKSLLTEQSEVFESMFAVPQGDGESDGHVESYEGLPLVHMPDTAEEVEELLNALRDPLAFCEQTTFSDTPLRIRNALHLASKYLMAELRAKLVRVVEREWPSSLDEMDMRDQAFEELKGRIDSDMLVQGWPIQFLPEPAAAIALAEEFNIKSILPAAYYDLTRCAPLRCWDASSETDGESFLKFNRYRGKAARWECLSATSILKMLRIRAYFKGEMTTKPNNPYNGGLVTNLACNLQVQSCSVYSARQRICNGVAAETKAANDLDQDMFLYLRHVRIKVLDLSETGLCSLCRSVFLDDIRRLRNKLWQAVEARAWSADGIV